jgi:hypothetical protein
VQGAVAEGSIAAILGNLECVTSGLVRRGPHLRLRSTTGRVRCDSGAKWPKATAKITDHLDVLLAFYDYPAEHWIHLRTTNPIESTFATCGFGSGSPRDPAREPPASLGHQVTLAPAA